VRADRRLPADVVKDKPKNNGQVDQDDRDDDDPYHSFLFSAGFAASLRRVPDCRTWRVSCWTNLLRP